MSTPEFAIVVLVESVLVAIFVVRIFVGRWPWKRRARRQAHALITYWDHQFEMVKHRDPMEPLDIDAIVEGGRAVIEREAAFFHNQKTAAIDSERYGGLL